MRKLKLGPREAKLIESRELYLLILRTVYRVFLGLGALTTWRAYASISIPSYMASYSKSASFSTAS